MDLSINGIQEIFTKLDGLYKCENRGLVDSIRFKLSKSGKKDFVANHLLNLKLLLRVNYT